MYLGADWWCLFSGQCLCLNWSHSRPQKKKPLEKSDHFGLKRSVPGTSPFQQRNKGLAILEVKSMLQDGGDY
ncbi:hypothetical protein Y1Q_0007126 [Alligator mississippiensis]|uniref:Uncharacterized protein n=1 Tax=Alligator mississippiensis TaxID=8496 RepID=A0A151N6C1_ALLMI|nr:hypothetical protein Y1Q_0007126 [Alligator mississippiensis]